MSHYRTKTIKTSLLSDNIRQSLPPKKETILKVRMTDMQRTRYKHCLPKDRDTENGGGGDRSHLLNVYKELKMACNHPYLFHCGQLHLTGEHFINNSGKMVLLDKMLKKLKERNSRVLIFSQMTRMLDILEGLCLYRGYKYCHIDENMTSTDREFMIDKFNAEGSEKFLFLLSTRAGGLGINLATADTVILYDSDWNPQVDLQAMDRAHHIGQKKEVSVFRFCIENSVEVKLIEEANTRRLDGGVPSQGRFQENQESISEDDLLNMIHFGAEEILKGTADSLEEVIIDDYVDAIFAEKGEGETKKEVNVELAQEKAMAVPPDEVQSSCECQDNYGFPSKNEMTYSPQNHTMIVNADILVAKVRDFSNSNHEASLTVENCLLHFGFKERVMESDGNCQFRAIADQICGDQQFHLVVRSYVVAQLLKDRCYRDFITDNYEDYVYGMSKAGIFEGWGDNITLHAAADAFGMKICILSSNDGLTCYEVDPKIVRSNQILWMTFRDNIHYNSIDLQQFATICGGPSKISRPRLPKLPNMQDFQFFDQDRIKELHDKECNYLRHVWLKEQERDGDDNSMPEVPPTALTDKEKEEKTYLLESAFDNWSKQDCDAFVRACAKYGRPSPYGPGSVADIAPEIEGKALQEVQDYAKVFWSKVHQLSDADRVLRQVEHGERMRGTKIDNDMNEEVKDSIPLPLICPTTPQRAKFIRRCLRRFGKFARKIKQKIVSRVHRFHVRRL